MDNLQDSRWLAAHLGVPLATVRKWRHLGIGPPVIKLGRLVRYRPSEVDAWVDRHAETAGPAA